MVVKDHTQGILTCSKNYCLHAPLPVKYFGMMRLIENVDTSLIGTITNFAVTSQGM
jgi:hypothetical protein